MKQVESNDFSEKKICVMKFLGEDPYYFHFVITLF